MMPQPLTDKGPIVSQYPMIRRLACTANSLGLARLSKRADTLSLLCDTLQQDRLLDAGSLVIYDLIFTLLEPRTCALRQTNT
jgi:hypothetical protein